MSYAGFCEQCQVPYYEMDALAHRHEPEPVAAPAVEPQKDECRCGEIGSLLCSSCTKPEAGSMRPEMPPSSEVKIDFYRNKLAHLRSQVNFIENNFPELAASVQQEPSPEVETEWRQCSNVVGETCKTPKVCDDRGCQEATGEAAPRTQGREPIGLIAHELAEIALLNHRPPSESIFDYQSRIEAMFEAVLLAQARTQPAPKCPKCGDNNLSISDDVIACGNSRCEWEADVSKFFFQSTETSTSTVTPHCPKCGSWKVDFTGNPKNIRHSIQCADCGWFDGLGMRLRDFAQFFTALPEATKKEK